MARPSRETKRHFPYLRVFIGYMYLCSCFKYIVTTINDRYQQALNKSILVINNVQGCPRFARIAGRGTWHAGGTTHK